MSADEILHASASRAALNTALEHAQPHLRPMIEAVRDHQVGMLLIGQSAEPFRIPKKPVRPVIVIIGDDSDRAVGPGGIHLPSMATVKGGEA